MGLNHNSEFQIPSLGAIWSQIYHLNTVLLGLFCPFSLFWSCGKPTLSKQKWGDQVLALRRLRSPCGAWMEACWGVAHCPEGNYRTVEVQEKRQRWVSWGCSPHTARVTSCSPRFTHLLIPAVLLPGCKSEHHFGWSSRMWWLLQVSWCELTATPCVSMDLPRYKLGIKKCRKSGF